jgi:hypothetical protein
MSKVSLFYLDCCGPQRNMRITPTKHSKSAAEVIEQKKEKKRFLASSREKLEASGIKPYLGIPLRGLCVGFSNSFFFFSRCARWVSRYIAYPQS